MFQIHISRIIYCPPQKEEGESSYKRNTRGNKFI